MQNTVRLIAVLLCVLILAAPLDARAAKKIMRVALTISQCAFVSNLNMIPINRTPRKQCHEKISNPGAAFAVPGLGLSTAPIP